MPKIFTRSLLVLILLAMFPPLMIARARAINSDKPRVHIFQDMDNQPKFRAQHVNEMFADGRAMRAYPEGTVPRGQLKGDTHFYFGLVDGQWATDFPMPLNETLLDHGQERFNIYCAPCHGESGDGNGMISVRARDLRERGTAPAWVDPKPVHDPVTMTRPVGELFNLITNGINTMPAYGPQISEADRWAIVAWVKVLQRAQVASWDELPVDVRDRLELQREEDIRKAAEEAAAEAARKAADQARNAEQNPSNGNEGGN